MTLADMIECDMQACNATPTELYDAVNEVARRHDNILFVGGMEWKAEERLAHATTHD